MYIEVIHDAQGNITHCYCADTLPENNGSPLFSVGGGLPVGHEQARLNIDTLTAMEIEDACGIQAVMNPITNQPEIKRIDRAEHIVRTFKVDTTLDKTPKKPLKNMPAQLKMRGMVKK